MVHSVSASILSYGKIKSTTKKARQEHTKAAWEAILADTESTSNICPEGKTLGTDCDSFKEKYPPLLEPSTLLHKAEILTEEEEDSEVTVEDLEAF